MPTTNSYGQDFRTWLKGVSALITERFELTLDDLPDMNTRDAFDNDVTAEDFFQDTVLDLMREEFGADVVDLFNPPH